MSNPALTTNTFQSAGRAISPADTMSLNGTVVKTGILLAILVAAGAVSWNLTFTASGGAINPIAIPMLIGGCLGGLILAFVTCFVPRYAPFTAPLYAAFEGLALGVISSITDAQPHLNGVVPTAVILTLGVLA